MIPTTPRVKQINSQTATRLSFQNAHVGPQMAKLRSFPFLQEDEFELACQAFCELFWARKGGGGGMDVVIERKVGSASEASD
jgi:hypothetical protein